MSLKDKEEGVALYINREGGSTGWGEQERFTGKDNEFYLRFVEFKWSTYIQLEMSVEYRTL